MTRLRVAVINGPNLSHLGSRQPEIYGSGTASDLGALLEDASRELGMEIDLVQHDGEGEFVSAVWQASRDCCALIVNPGGYSHTSVAVLDALEAFPGIVAEVHISQVFRREEERRNLLTARAADLVIVGAGLQGYRLAAEYIARSVAEKASRGISGGSDDNHQ
jgi:3-dehydroquinate dehydratase II